MSDSYSNKNGVLNEEVKCNHMTKRNRNKRTRERDSAKKAEKPAKTINDVKTKNAVMMLNELFSADQAPIYKVVCQEGPANNPSFVMTCTVKDQTFQGTGKSKKEAKLACSKEAMLRLFGDAPFLPDDEGIQNRKPRVRNSVENLLEIEGKNPVSILNELYPGVQYQLISSNGPSHSPEFVMRASLPPSLVVTGSGKSKKDAKLNASKALLVQLHEVEFNPITSEMMLGTTNGKSDKEDNFGHSFADQVASLVTEKFNDIFGQTSHSKRKVLAGFVVTRDGKSSVVCLSTGTKCINGENLSMNGASVNDSHAEILARRSLVYWLYDQLLKACNVHQQKESIFTPAPSGEGFDLKPDVNIDMYINTAPCGDSRLFAMNEQTDENQNLLTSPTGKIGEGNRGKLRSKVESGMGTVPLPEESQNMVQTWDGIQGGERLLTMSCSDKILRWNILGCQGSLLCHWIKPLYLRSITIGSRYHPGHMTRAFYGRINMAEACAKKERLTAANCVGNAAMTSEFRINEPQLLATTSPEARAVWKTSDNCVNWILGTGPEILNGVNGKLQSGDNSRLCKASFLSKFQAVMETAVKRSIVPRHVSTLDTRSLSKMSYSELKKASTAYQARKSAMVTSLDQSGLGKWMNKPQEIDMFYSK